MLATSSLLLACAPSDPATSDLVRVERAWFHPSASEQMPLRDDPGWRPVDLPDFWGLTRRAKAHEGWYRLEFPADGDGPWAALIPGDWDSLYVELNGDPQIEALPQYADMLPTAPSLLLLIRGRDLRPGGNELALRFQTAVWRIGSLGAITTGPAAIVQTERERRYLRQSVLPSSFAWFALACGAIVALLGRWEETRAARWFAAGTAAWCLPLLEPMRSLIDFHEGLPSSVLLHSFPPFFAIGFHRALQLRRPRVERVLLGTIVAGTAVRVLAPPLLVPGIDWLWWMVDIAIATYLLQLALRTRRAGTMPRATGMLVAGALGILAGLHDVVSLVVGRPLLGFALSPYAPAVLGLATAAALVRTLGQRLAMAQRLNFELEERVEEKRLELAGSYARMAELERDRAIAAERERLMREMHDGTGGQIVSALAMVEGGSFERSAIIDVLHDALADLRFSIDSLAPSEPDLLSLLGAARARIEPRLEARGMRFSWEVRDVPRPAHFGPQTALQGLRIFQEAVVNALRHADASVVTVRTGEERDASGAHWVFVEIADDGKGIAPEVRESIWKPLFTTKKRGTGLGLPIVVNIIGRHEGLVSFDSEPGRGTTFRVSLPPRAASEEPEPDQGGAAEVALKG